MLAGSELGETAITTINDDRLDAGQVSHALFEQLATHPNIVWSGRVGPNGDRQPQDLDEDGSLDPDRPSAAVDGVVERWPTRAHCAFVSSTIAAMDR